MPSIHDAAIYLADAITAEFKNTVTRAEYDALLARDAALEARIAALEDGDDPDPPDPPVKPWEQYFPTPLGYAARLPECDEQCTITGGSAAQIDSMRDALKAGGVAVLVEANVLLDFAGRDIFIGANGALVGLGSGFVYQNGSIRIESPRVLLRNAELATNAGGDGLKVTGPMANDVRIDGWTGGYAGDEMLDIWEGVRNVTLSRCLFPDTGKVDFGLIIGSAPADESSQNTSVTLFECVSYTEQRFPIVGRARVHMVNNVKPRWAHAAVQVHTNAHVLSERNWYGPTAGKPQNVFLDQDGTGTVTSEGDVFDGIPNPGSSGLAFATPYGPLGVTMDEARRLEVLGLAGRGRVLVL